MALTMLSSYSLINSTRVCVCGHHLCLCKIEQLGGKKASVALKRPSERACVNTEYLVSHLTDVTLPSTHSAPLSPELRASSAGRAFVLLDWLTLHMHHVGGFECVIIVLGIKYSHAYNCNLQWKCNYGGYTILMSLMEDLRVCTGIWRLFWYQRESIVYI